MSRRSDTHDLNDLIQRVATWLPRLADEADFAAAGSALFSLSMKAPPSTARSDDRDAPARELYARALASLGPRVDALIPAWIARLIDIVERQHREKEVRRAAISAGEDMPDIDFAPILAGHEIVRAITVAGSRADAHLRPIVEALGRTDRDADERLCEALECAGPGIAPAVPALLDLLRTRGLWCWPSHLSRALVRASTFEPGVIQALRAMLDDPSQQVRSAAMSVLGQIGPAAGEAASQLLSFRDGDEEERIGMLHALGGQRNTSGEFLDVLEAAMRDESGYVRRAAVYELARLTPDADRFVPLLIEAVDYPHYLHDTSLPEAAIDALAAYGPRAKAAVPRLARLLNGPMAERTRPAKEVKAALDAIEGRGDSAASSATRYEPARRPSPVADEEPLFAVCYRGRHCYVDREGRLAIETKFESGSEFQEGYAIVSGEGHETFVIDRRGEIVFDAGAFRSICPFSEGLAAVERDGKWGFVNRHGRVVVEPTYDAVTSFSEGLAGVEMGRSDVPIGKRGGVTYTRPGRRGFINRMGDVVIPIEWADAGPFHGGRAVVCTGRTTKPNEFLGGVETLADRTYGYIDTSGRLAVAGPYGLADAFAEGLALVQPVGPLFLRSRYGYVDADGRVVIPMEFTRATAFRGGVAVVRRRGRVHRDVNLVIDRTGSVVGRITGVSLLGECSVEGLAPAFSSTSGLYGYVNVQGRMVIEPQFDEAKPFRDGLAAVQREDWFGLIDVTGRFVWGPIEESPAVYEYDRPWHD